MAVVVSLFRYPVKSMGGEELTDAEVTIDGLTGDRAWALVDGANSVGTAKKRPGLLQFSARFVEPPQAGRAAGAVHITLPDGATATSEQADISEILSKALGHAMTLMSAAPEGLRLEFPAGTLAGKHAETTEGPMPAGSFFDCAAVHLLTTSTLARLSEFYPEGRFDVRRFRPNFVIQTEAAGFAENEWMGRTLALGNDVLLRVSMPTARCPMPTLPQGDLPRDPGILRTALQHNRHDRGDFGQLPCVGVYADVIQPGRVRRGDAVRVI